MYSWKLDNTENFSRMRMKLARSYPYSSHAEASLLRDKGDIGESVKVEVGIEVLFVLHWSSLWSVRLSCGVL